MIPCSVSPTPEDLKYDSAEALKMLSLEATLMACGWARTKACRSRNVGLNVCFAFTTLRTMLGMWATKD